MHEICVGAEICWNDEMRFALIKVNAARSVDRTGEVIPGIGQ